MNMSDSIKFTCKVGKMKDKGKILWIPLRYADFFDVDSYVEIQIRKLK